MYFSFLKLAVEHKFHPPCEDTGQSSLVRDVVRRVAKKIGFTLVELSIVLVIVGLVIGGLLVGQSMIESAQINRFAKEVQTYDIAVSNFKSKYKQLPGDSTLFGAGGNNDGLIGNISVINGWKAESGNFWRHLNISGFDPSNSYVSAITGGISNKTSTRNIPGTALSPDGGVIATAPYWGAYAALPSDWGTQHMYIAGNFKATTGYNSWPTASTDNCNLQACGIVTRIVARAIDTKMDNGNQSTGDVVSNDPWSNTFCTASTQCNSAGGVDCLCPIRVKILSQQRF
jgi:prepilin-type N-terminal cleavage/methylation domain-containing protein